MVAFDTNCAMALGRSGFFALWITGVPIFVRDAVDAAWQEVVASRLLRLPGSFWRPRQAKPCDACPAARWHPFTPRAGSGRNRSAHHLTKKEIV